MVQALLDQQPNDPIRVEQKVTPARVLVPDDRVQGLQLRCLSQREDTRRERRGGTL